MNTSQRRQPPGENHAEYLPPEDESWGSVRYAQLQTAEDRVRVKARSRRTSRIIIGSLCAVLWIGIVGFVGLGVAKAVNASGPLMDTLDAIGVFDAIPTVATAQEPREGQAYLAPAVGEALATSGVGEAAQAVSDSLQAAAAEATEKANAPKLPLSYSDVTSSEETTLGIWTPTLSETIYNQEGDTWYATGRFSYEFINGWEGIELGQFTFNSSEVELQGDGQVIDGALVLQGSPKQGYLVAKVEVAFEGAYAEQPLREQLKGHVLEGLLKKSDGDVVKRSVTFS